MKFNIETRKNDWQSKVSAAMVGIGACVAFGSITMLDYTGKGFTSALLGFAVGGIGAFWNWCATQAALRKLPIVKVPARVVRHHMEVEGSGRDRRNVYYLKFQPNDGDWVQLEVSEIDYNRLDDGSEGILHYRGWQFLFFGRGALEDATPIMQPLPEDERLLRSKQEAVKPASEPVTKITPAPQETGVLTHELDE